jgi:hypothetical protein
VVDDNSRTISPFFRYSPFGEGQETPNGLVAWAVVWEGGSRNSHSSRRSTSGETELCPSVTTPPGPTRMETWEEGRKVSRLPLLPLPYTLPGF